MFASALLVFAAASVGITFVRNWFYGREIAPLDIGLPLITAICAVLILAHAQVQEERADAAACTESGGTPLKVRYQPTLCLAPGIVLPRAK